MKKKVLIVSVLLISFFSVFCLFSCSHQDKQLLVKETPDWAIGDWVVEGKLLFSIQKEGQVMYTLQKSPLKLLWDEPKTINDVVYTATIEKSDDGVFETKIISNELNSKKTLSFSNTIEKSDNDEYIFSSVESSNDGDNLSNNTFKEMKAVAIKNNDVIIPNTNEGKCLKFESDNEFSIEIVYTNKSSIEWVYIGDAYVLYGEKGTLSPEDIDEDKLKKWEGTIEYSTPTSNWCEWNAEKITATKDDNGKYVIFMRGYGNTKITNDGVCEYYYFDDNGERIVLERPTEDLSYAYVSRLNPNRFNIEGESVYCYGDIRTLLDYRDVENTIMSPACFNYAFAFNTALVSAPSLPSCNLSAFCYSNMFEGCSFLLDCPSLPSDKLAPHCYEQMFKDCVLIKKTPTLSSLDLIFRCYSSMFKGCTSLSTISALPAIIKREYPLHMLSYCFESMFEDCASLKISDRKSTDYSNKCCEFTHTNGCRSMFEGTSGEFVGTPEDGKTYYCMDDVVYEECSPQKMYFSQSDISINIRDEIELLPLFDPWYCQKDNISICYESSDPNVATIDENGIVNSKDLGNTIITASVRTSKEDVFKCALNLFVINQFDKDSSEYLKFESPESFTITSKSGVGGKTWDGEIEYCNDGLNWQIWNGETINANKLADSDVGEKNYVIYLRGYNNTNLTGFDVFYGSDGFEHSWLIEGQNVSCKGDIRTLLDWDKYESITEAEDCAFMSLFANNSSLVDAPLLEFKSLGQKAFQSMFENCTSLVNPPDLPASTVCFYSYCNMFRNCKSLKKTPVFGRINEDYYLTMSCYEGMFQNCVNLESICIIPAYNIEDFNHSRRVFRYMYDGCTKLKISDKKSSEYPYEFRLNMLAEPDPDFYSSDTSTISMWVTNMFGFTPEFNKSYFFANKLIYPKTEECDLKAVSFVKSNITANIGDKLIITADDFECTPYYYKYSDPAFIKGYSSSNPAVAVVDDDGVVTALSHGKAVITAIFVGEKTAECNLTVIKPILVENITLNSTAVSLDVGKSYNLSATVFPLDAADKMIFWKSSDSSVASVDNSGKVTANAVGSADIIATSSNGVSAVCKVNVCIPANSITLSQTSAILTKGDKLQLTASILPKNTTDKTITWKSSDSSVASVDKSGKVTANAAGTANITASTANGKVCKCSIKVLQKITESGGSAIPPRFSNAVIQDSMQFVSYYQFTLQVSDPKWNGGFEYYEFSSDKWKTWDGRALTAVKREDRYVLCIRGYNNTKIASNFVFNGKEICSYGDIELLLDYRRISSNYRYYKKDIQDGCFASLFAGNDALVIPPTLKLEKLSNSCYAHMFANCKNLAMLPDLGSARGRKIACYYGMFQGCSSIKVSETQNAECKNAYFLPEAVDGWGEKSNDNMFLYTDDGKFTGLSWKLKWYTKNPVIK